jgi:predicted DNA-binding transcriptional regulator AlpA
MSDQRERRFLRKRQVAARYGITERSVDRRTRDGTLPKPIYVGPRCPRWDESALEELERAAFATAT